MTFTQSIHFITQSLASKLQSFSFRCGAACIKGKINHMLSTSRWFAVKPDEERPQVVNKSAKWYSNTKAKDS
jgi:hypothetical protein